MHANTPWPVRFATNVRNITRKRYTQARVGILAQYTVYVWTLYDSNSGTAADYNTYTACGQFCNYLR